jgi:hypothetical protein
MITDLIVTWVPVLVRLLGGILVVGAALVLLAGLRDLLCLFVRGGDYWK